LVKSLLNEYSDTMQSFSRDTQHYEIKNKIAEMQVLDKYNSEFPSSLQKSYYPILYNIKQTSDKAGLSALIMHSTKGQVISEQKCGVLCLAHYIFS
jgi:hypothetical protein